MITVRARPDKLVAGLQAARSDRAPRREAMRELGRQMATELYKTAPIDTGRYRNGWAQAARAAGVASLPTPPLTPSRFTENIRRALVRQTVQIENEYVYLEGLISNWYTKKGRAEDKWSRRWRKRLDLLQKRYGQTLEAIAAIDRGEALGVVDLGRGTVAHGRFVAQRTRPKKGKGVKLYARPYVQALGGTGKIIDTPSETVLILHNLEPHASFAARQANVTRRVRRILRSEQSSELVRRKYATALARQFALEAATQSSALAVR